MASSSTYRRFKRRIGQLIRRVEAGVLPSASQISSDLSELLRDLQRSTPDEPEVAVETALYLLETMPRVFLYLDDRMGHLVRALEQVPGFLADVLKREAKNPLSVLDRAEVMERVFCLWVGDDSGYLKHLGETLLESVVTREDEDAVIRICTEHLRHIPLVFPVAHGEKLDLDRAILQADRHRVEHLLGQIYASRNKPDYAVIVGRSHFRNTGDAVDLIEALIASGERSEARELARRVLRRPDAVRKEEVREIYEAMGEEPRTSELDAGILAAIDAFVDEPTWEVFQSLLDAVDGCWEVIREEVLARLRADGGHPEILLRIYLDEGDILEADGLVTTQTMDPRFLAESAYEIMESHPANAAGWLFIAAHGMAKVARRSNYLKAVEYLETVRDLSDLAHDEESFAEAMIAFRELYGRRRLLMQLLDESGL